jgi:hypothetical protein
MAAKKSATKTVKKAVKKTASKSVKKKATKKKAVKKKAAPSKAVTKPVISPRERYEMIATMAYYRAEKRGFAPGNELDDWIECEQIVDSMLSAS